MSLDVEAMTLLQREPGAWVDGKVVLLKDLPNEPPATPPARQRPELHVQLEQICKREGLQARIFPEDLAGAFAEVMTLAKVPLEGKYLSSEGVLDEEGYEREEKELEAKINMLQNKFTRREQLCEITEAMLLTLDFPVQFIASFRKACRVLEIQMELEREGGRP